MPSNRLPLLAAAVAAAAALAACGGGSPLDNPAGVVNGSLSGTGQKLSFAYFQRCINPIFLAELKVTLNGVVSTNTCASAGCHARDTGSGGSLRLAPEAKVVSLNDAASTPDALRASDMYVNFYSAQAATVPGSPSQSRLLTKPQVLGAFHGGGLIFDTASDENVRRITYWITHPAPLGQDEFSRTTDTLFTPPEPMTGACNNNP